MADIGSRRVAYRAVGMRPDHPPRTNDWKNQSIDLSCYPNLTPPGDKIDAAANNGSSSMVMSYIPSHTMDMIMLVAPACIDRLRNILKIPRGPRLPAFPSLPFPSQIALLSTAIRPLESNCSSQYIIESDRAAVVAMPVLDIFAGSSSDKGRTDGLLCVHLVRSMRGNLPDLKLVSAFRQQ